MVSWTAYVGHDICLQATVSIYTHVTCKHRSRVQRSRTTDTMSQTALSSGSVFPLSNRQPLSTVPESLTFPKEIGTSSQGTWTVQQNTPVRETWTGNMEPEGMLAAHYADECWDIKRWYKMWTQRSMFTRIDIEVTRRKVEWKGSIK
jgi:hypothetical protein